MIQKQEAQTESLCFFYSRLVFAKKTLYIMKGSELNGYSL